VPAALWAASVALVIGYSPSDAGVATLAGIPMAVYAVTGSIVVRSHPRHPIGWLFCGVGLSVGLYVFGLAYGQAGLGSGGTIGDLPGATAVVWIAIVSMLGVLPVALPVFLLVFPDGALRSRRWRPALWLTLAGGALLVLGSVAIGWDQHPIVLEPLIRSGSLRTGYTLGVILIIAASFVGLLALLLRFRESAPGQRAALRLLVGVLIAMAGAMVVFIALIFAPRDAAWPVPFFILALVVLAAGLLFGIPLAAASAVLTFGIYDVGVVVKKTVVYVALVVVFLMILALVAVLVNPLLLIGTSVEQRNVARITTAAAVVIAFLVLGFRPVQRLARRLVYGRRSTPYEAMSELSERLGEAYSTNDVLPRMASIVRASTGAAVARIWLRVGAELRPVASAPADAREPATLALDADDVPAIDGVRAFAVRDRGELLGALTLEMPAAEPLSKTGERLVADLAGQAGLVLRNVRLVEELQESRRRIVTAQDERARKLERNLHDGAQQQLVALAVKIGLIEQLAVRDPAKIGPMLAQAKAETLDALDTLRDLARGIYPPLLADQGLVAALEAQARKSPIDVSLEGSVERFDQEIEAAVYFCCLEALQNIAKYANASRATIGLERTNGHLTFRVADDGVGFEPSAAHGSGLTNMRDRLEALGGSLGVESAPERGTTIRGAIPVETP
jgi:signal transduction histidine kinase